MPGSQRDLDSLVAASENGELTLQELQGCAANIIKLLLRVTSETAYEEQKGKNKWK